MQLSNVENVIKNKLLPLYIKLSLPQGGRHEFDFPFFNEAIWGKHWKEDVGLSGLALQSNVPTV